MSNFIEKQIIVSGIETSPFNNTTKYKIKDQDGHSYSFFQHKTDGNQSQAFINFATLPNGGNGVNVMINYVEKPNPQNAQYPFKNITNIKPATQPLSAPQAAPQATPPPIPPNPPQNQPLVQTKPSQQPSQEYWEKKSFGMCKHAYLVETFKYFVNSGRFDLLKTLDMTKIEKEAEKWANMSMRQLPKVETPQFTPEQTNQYPTQMPPSTTNEEIQTDNIPF